ncbi:MAG: hypothetical protein CMM48_15580 [Rhodospirillaceae bacterium]|nr:hypothetical protein [Rhodospirillaceae bacterium]
MVESAFLRSINIQLDVGHPERLRHFRPTSKSGRFVSSLLQDGGSALFVVAPYGSGKSITAGYVGHLVENLSSSESMLEAVEERIAGVDDTLHGVVRDRRMGDSRGLFVPMYGHAQSTPSGLKEGLLTAMRRCKMGRQAKSLERIETETAQDVFELVSACSAKLDAAGYDRLVIVWDEFGRHLQGLISEGRPEELDVLQVLAEVVSRPASIPVSLGLLMHRSLLGYASGLPSGVRREWAKIEGRFETLQYVDDSSEMHELVGSLVSESRSVIDNGQNFQELAARAHEVGLFADSEEDRLAEALSAAYPLEPATLFLLPRVAARVAQNERTLFSFLQATALEEPVRPSALYDYFRGDFRSDAGAGGTQKPWLETESALQKVPHESTEGEALKSAFLLGLGLGGERARTTHAQLAFALSPGQEAQASEAIGHLIDRKLLVHRKHSDQVVVWHGTDLDLRGRLDDEKRRESGDFQLALFLGSELPPPVWRPVEYNAQHGIRRYLTSEYVTVDRLQAIITELGMLGGLEPGCDGRVLYVLPRSRDEELEALSIAETITDPRMFVAVASEVAALREAALDLRCLLRMNADQELIGSDPLVQAELDHLSDDARTGLQPMVDRVLLPQAAGSTWFHKGEPIGVKTVPQLRRIMSETMRDVFPSTPEISSEMVVRRTPSSVVVNARKKVELGLLERYGQEHLGIEGNFADKAVFQCVFHRTGLYLQDGTRWRLAEPSEIELPGLQAVWENTRLFFVEPGKNKSLRRFIDQLRAPPFGVREGLIPLFLAAGFKAFPRAIVIRHKGAFVEDLLPSVIEDACKNPDDYALDVLALGARQEKYLRGLLKLFSGENGARKAPEEDLMRSCADALVEWHHRLPEAAPKSRYLSEPARKFARHLISLDPARLFLEELPPLVGATTNQPRKLIDGVTRLRDELEGIEARFVAEAAGALGQMLVSRGIQNGTSVRKQAVRWASHFPKSFSRDLPDHVTKGVLNSLRKSYRDDRSLVNALSVLLVGLPISQWDDAIVPSFRRQLRSAFEVIEGTALDLSQAPDLDPELRKGLTALAEAKVETIVNQLADIIGTERAAKRIEGIAQELRKTVTQPTE